MKIITVLLFSFISLFSFIHESCALTQQEKNTIVDEMIVDVERIYFEEQVRQAIVQVYRNGESLDEMILILKGMTSSYTPDVTALDLTALSTTISRRAPAEDIDKATPEGVKLRAMIELHNKRTNLLANKINEIISAASGPGTPASRLDAISAVVGVTPRTRMQAVQDFKDDISAGNLDR